MNEILSNLNENLREIQIEYAENLAQMYNSPRFIPEDDIYVIDFPDKFTERENRMLNQYINANKILIESEVDGAYYPYLYSIKQQISQNSQKIY